MDGIEARGKELIGTDGFNGSLHRWELPKGGSIRLASMQYEDDKKHFQGRPFDLYVFDETTEFTETQVRFVMGWNRTTKPGQKCRVLMPFNPPLDEAGEWVVRFFAPWLDDTHKNPAQDGELRWYIYDENDGDTEVPDNTPIIKNGTALIPKSRTFFHSTLKDNPILEATGYQSQIDAMPEPIRSLLKGNFDANKQIDPFQVIPAAWVRAAQQRWIESEQPEVIKAVGVDVARGGQDKTVISTLRLERFDELHKYPGKATPDGQTVSMLVNNLLGEQAPVIGVDVIGVGASAYDQIKTKRQAMGINFGAGDDRTDRSGEFHFVNVRAAAYWIFREALDPDYGATIALPPDKELLGDLCAPKWSVKTGRIYIESKDEIIKRLGRSPDCADAVVLAWWCACNARLQIF